MVFCYSTSLAVVISIVLSSLPGSCAFVVTIGIASSASRRPPLIDQNSRFDKRGRTLIFAKKKSSPPSIEESNEIPANLRRKIKAKRKPLGHVVPEHTKVKGSGGSSNPRLRPQGKARAEGLNNPSMLKIIGGKARGRRLDSPDVYLRPMMGKVREAVYSTFTSFGLYDSDRRTKHLDIFSGSGSVGLESVSRGATHCTFVDLSQDCCNAIKRNLKWCRFDDMGHKIICNDAFTVLREPQSVGLPETMTYQIITLCPPYEEIVYADLLDAVANSPLVTDDTIVLIEYPVELGCLPHVYTRDDGGKMIGVRNRKYGRTVIAMYIVNPTGNLEVASSRPEEFVDI